MDGGRQVPVERCVRGHAGLLHLDDHQRQAVDEADTIGLRFANLTQASYFPLS
jgi:hypothetical protein